MMWSVHHRRGHSLAAATVCCDELRRRNGFTLLELVMVIGIMSILAGLSLAALNGAFSDARENQTGAIIAIVDGVLRDREQFYRDEVLDGEGGRFRYFNTTGQTAFFQSTFAAANGGAAPSVSSANYFVKKKLYAAVFPQRFVDICGFDGRPGGVGADDDGNGSADFVGGTTIDLFEVGLGGDDPPVADIIRQAVIDRGATVVLANHNPATESSEILYLCLTNPIVPGISVLDPEDIPASYIADTDNDGLLEILDGYERPLRFYTFNTGLFRPTAWTWSTTTAKTGVTVDQSALAYELAGRAVRFTPANISATDRTNGLNRDLDDRFGSVRRATTTNMAAPDNLLAASFSYGGVTSAPLAPGLPVSFGTFTTPMVVSAGPDESLGLGEPTATDGTQYATPIDVTAAFDNMTNLQGGQL